MRRILTLFLALSLGALCACGGGAPAAQPGAYTFTDSLGNSVSLDAPPRRVAALLGSFGECWLLAGGGESLVAVTQDAFTERGLELGEAVVELGLSHQPNLEALLGAGPDLVLLSADLEGQLALGDALSSAGVPAAWFKVEDFSDYLSMLEIFTALTGREDLYRAKGLDIQTKIEDTIAAVPAGEGPSILLLRAYSSNVKAKNSDNTAGMMLKALGCDNIADSDSGLLEELQMEAILSADPEHIFVVTMGSDTQKALDNLKALFASDPAWASLTAVREGKVHVLDKKLFHYKPNARWGESYETLFHILYQGK